MAETSAPVRDLSLPPASVCDRAAELVAAHSPAGAGARIQPATLGSPTCQTLLALLRPQGTPYVQPGTDWQELAALAERLWLEPRLAVRASQVSSVPGALRQRWADARRTTAAHNLLLEQEQAALLDAMEHAGVEVIPLKGASLARILYNDPAARPVTDIDLGVRATEVARAAEVLRTAGYHVALPASLMAHRAFLAGTDEFTSEVKCVRETAAAPVAVELHWKWLPLPEDEVWAAVQQYESAGVRTLSPEHYFLFLCSHVAGGSWAGLRWLCDLADFLTVLGPRMDAALCVRLARQAGLRRATGVTLALVEEFFGVSEARLAPLLDASARRAARRWRHRPFEPFLTGTQAAIHGDRLRVQDNAGRRMAYLARLFRPTYREWRIEDGGLRPAPAAWALRSGRLARLCAGALWLGRGDVRRRSPRDAP